MYVMPGDPIESGRLNEEAIRRTEKRKKMI